MTGCTLSLQKRPSEGIKFAYCCVALIPSTLGYVSPSSALYPAQILCLLALESSRKKNFFIFKADQEGVTYEHADWDNAENKEIIPF